MELRSTRSREDALDAKDAPSELGAGYTSETTVLNGAVPAASSPDVVVNGNDAESVPCQLLLTTRSTNLIPEAEAS